MTKKSTVAKIVSFDEIQGKAKAAYDKGTSVLTTFETLAEGQVNALLEAGNILSSGLQDLGKSLTVDGKENLSMLADEIRGLAAATSPMEAYNLQSGMVRRNLESVFAIGARNNEAILSLVKETAGPLAKQFDAAMEAVRKVS